MSEKPPRLTAKQIQWKLFQVLEGEKKHRPVVTNHHLPDWFECDVCSVTKAGLLYEFEIKLTRADFRKDALKTHRHVPKYDLLRAGQGACPSRFTYVTPAGLLTLGDIPDFAGLWEIVTAPGRVPRLQEVRAPRQLHGRKLTAKQIQSLYRLFYWRYWGTMKHKP